MSGVAQDQQHRWRHAFPCAPEAVRPARNWVRACLKLADAGFETTETAVLVVSELATNAVAHTPSTHFRVALGVEEAYVRVEVTDQGGPSHPRMVEATPWQESGRGLALVQQFAAYWGCCSDTKGTTVFAELAPPQISSEHHSTLGLPRRVPGAALHRLRARALAGAGTQP